MIKYIYFALIIILTISCRDSKVVVEDTKYFTFERPVTLAFDTLIYFDQSSNLSAAQKAIGNKNFIDPQIKGEFIIDGISVHFIVKNPKSNDIVPCYCSDYSVEYLKQNGETISQKTHEYRFVEGKNNDTEKRWIELCIDMKHQFFAKEIDMEKFDTIKELLKTIKIKPQS